MFSFIYTWPKNIGRTYMPTFLFVAQNTYVAKPLYSINNNEFLLNQKSEKTFFVFDM